MKMRSYSVSYVMKLAGLAMVVVSCTAWTQVAVVVDADPFGSVEDAAFGEAQVNWNDADDADDTSCTQCFAAVELRDYLRKMAGAPGACDVADDDAQVSGECILIGGPASNRMTAQHAEELGLTPERMAQLGRDGYIIQPGPEKSSIAFVIAGGSRLGTLYGVYDFLHRQGCRWLAPGEVNEEVPQRGLEEVVPVEVTGRPDFGMRGFHAWEDRGNPDFILWMARNRLNYWCVEEEDHPRLRKLGIRMVWGGHVLGYEYLRPGDAYPYNHPEFEGDDGLPEDPYPVSGDYQGDADGSGALSYIEAHPEWYGMNAKGERVTTLRNGDYNYCTSNPHATAELMKNAVSELIDGEAKDAEIVNCWTVDAGKWCQCEACKAIGTPTDRNLRFVHAFDQAVKDAQAKGQINRSITLLFLAYADVLEPPSKPLPDTFDYDTCIATYFPIVRSYVSDFDNPGDPVNARYAKHLHGWAVDPARHYKGKICIGEYYNVSGYKCLPICYMHTMANDIPYYCHQMNARNFHYMHVTTRNWGNKSLTNYQMARQLWDTELDCQALWADFFVKRYGTAAALMRDFYESLEAMLCNCSQLKYHLPSRLSRGDRPIFNSDYMPYEPGPEAIGPSFTEILAAKDACRQTINRVMASGLPERIEARVAEDEMMFTYGERTIDFYNALAQTYFAIDEGRRAEAREWYRKARELAVLLEADTESAQHSSSHANAANALIASRAGGALSTIMQVLGPDDPVKLSLTQGEAVLTGRDFHGGGATRYGYGLNVFPGRINVSDRGNYVYAAGGKPLDRMTAWFELDGVPDTPVTLTFTGLSRPVTDEDTVPARFTLNGETVFEGDIPFSYTELSSFEVTVPAGAFKEGVNRLDVRNTHPEGRVANRPWFGVHEVVFSR